jgi:hypothetical protein
MSLCPIMHIQYRIEGVVKIAKRVWLVPQVVTKIIKCDTRVDRRGALRSECRSYKARLSQKYRPRLSLQHELGDAWSHTSHPPRRTSHFIFKSSRRSPPRQGCWFPSICKCRVSLVHWSIGPPCMLLVKNVLIPSISLVITGNQYLPTQPPFCGSPFNTSPRRYMTCGMPQSRSAITGD